MNQASPDNADHLALFVEEMVEVTSQLQAEISVSLLAHKGTRDCFNRNSVKPGNQVLEIINKAVHAFVGVMPLASANNINIFVQAMRFHSILTGDPTIIEIVKKISEKHNGPMPTLEDLADHE